MFPNEKLSNQKQHQYTYKEQERQSNSLKNVLTCLLVTLLLLFEGHAIEATPIIRLRQQQEQQQQNPYPHSNHNHHSHQEDHHHPENNVRDCEHKSLVELIKTSPIILKALGSHIFTHFDEDDDLRILQSANEALLSSWQSEQNEFVALRKATASSTSSSSLSALHSSSTFPDLLNDKQKSSQQSSHGNAMRADKDAILTYSSPSSSSPGNALLITLTPDTIYKGASLLKTATNAAVTASNSRSGSTFGSGLNAAAADNSDAGNDGDSLYSSSESMVDGQLNATVQPLSCFDGNLLKMLPTDLIIFGKLITMDQQPQNRQHQHQAKDFINAHHVYGGTSSSSSSSSSSTHQQQQQTPQPLQQPKDILKISINGLHRWSPQFESYIWTHLGWDDWSDYTVCSVACGKGVQQRFRRCLLDNPMVDMKMNFNEIEEEEIEAEEEELEVEQQVEEYDDDKSNNSDSDDEAETDADAGGDAEEEKQYDDIDRMIFEDDDDDEIIEQLKAIDNYDNDSNDGRRMTDDDDDDDAVQALDDNVLAHSEAKNKKHRRRALLTQADAADDGDGDGSSRVMAETPQTDVYEMDNNMLHFVTSAPSLATAAKALPKRAKIVAKTTTTEQPEIMRIFEGEFNDVYSERIYNESPFSAPQLPEERRDDLMAHKKGQRPAAKHKRHKSAKIVSTMFCEGYNIEQRTCNNFECSDDINDLLKFYRKYPSTEESSATSTQTLNADFNTAPSSSSSLPSSSSSSSSAVASSVANTLGVAPSTLTNDLGAWNSLTEGYNQNTNTMTPIPINTGFVQTWHNLLNFTIMLTIRAKNDSYNSASTTATIFSIRNGTHNLYLETYRDGLHLYLERDKTTEMLPIQFNLYDYRWHQVAISIKNGDFITIYIDCSWSNSFVVSKRLFSLPLDADVEVGRGFNGELQQLLILPRLQGRRQCSEKRISINEVKRYIIDTFIGDYGNYT